MFYEAEEYAKLVKDSRTVRRYQENYNIPQDDLNWLVNNCRFTASAGNRQPTRFIIINDKKIRDQIFPALAWLGYLSEDLGPEEGERPAAYIILLHDTRVPKASVAYDAGIVSQTINLGANILGYGCCIVGSVNHGVVSSVLNIPPHLKIGTIIALGKPREVVVIEQCKDIFDVKYWRDEERVHHVPKLSLEDILVDSYCEE